MQQPGRVERVWWPRLRWRMRGAWQWPAFAVLTPLDAVLLTELPFYGRGARSIVAGLLLACFANLVAVGIVAPLLGARLRRARPGWPRPVAVDYAGAAVLCAVTLGLLCGGLLHRPALAAHRADVAGVVASVNEYVAGEAPEYRSGLAAIDARRLDDDLYRACVPGADPDRWLCLFVSTDQHPPGIARDRDSTPNQRFGGPR